MKLHPYIQGAIGTLFVILSMVIASCSKNDDPIHTSPQYRLSFIYSAETTQIFHYNSKDKIKEWLCADSKTSQTIAHASYDYDAGGSNIMINAEEFHGDQKWIFEEMLGLNIDGTAAQAQGIVEIYNVEDNSLLMKKRYNAVFNYNTAKQPVSIKIIEKRMDDNIEDPYPLQWNIDLVWNANNLIKSEEYVNPTSPLKVCEYTYYDGVKVDYASIIQYPMLRSYYTPLQYQGRFGVQSKDLIKKATIDNNYTTDYSYNLYTNSIYSMMEDYVEKTPDGKETKYTVGWEQL